MRFFKLDNSVSPTPETYDITTQEALFHDIAGLGFEEETTFRQVGSVWRLNKHSYAQRPVTGKICFTDMGGTTPYEKYTQFKAFIDKPPLTLYYYPDGLDGLVYRKKVRVTKIAKTELTQYGVLDVDIDFTPYTPWYEIVTASSTGSIGEDDTGWVWGDDADNPPLTFEPEDDTVATRAKFRGEIHAPVEFTVTSDGDSPIKLTIHGPATKPFWTHYVDGELISSGGFDNSYNFSLSSTEELVIDNTEGAYAMYVYDSSTYETRNVYSLRNFDLPCFFNLKKGRNVISVTSLGGVPTLISVEGHVHYATV